MFEKLEPLLESLNLEMKLSFKDGKIRMIIIFKIKDEDKSELNLSPIVLEASGAELDEGLINELVEAISQSVPSISKQVKLLVNNLDKIASEKTNKTLSKKKEPIKKEEIKNDLFKDTETKINQEKTIVKKKPIKKEVIKEKTIEEAKVIIDKIIPPSDEPKLDFEEPLEEHNENKKPEAEPKIDFSLSDDDDDMPF